VQHWVKYLLYSFLIHIVILSLFWLNDVFAPAPVKTLTKPVKIKSYLYEVPKKRITQQKVIVEESERPETEPEIEALSIPQPTEETEQITSTDLQKQKSPSEEVAIEELVVEEITVENESSTNDPISKMDVTTAPSIVVGEKSLNLRNATTKYLEQQAIQPGSWSEHQSQRQQGNHRSQGSLHSVDDTYFAKGAPARVVGKSVDGSTQVKMHGTCYNIARDQFGDNLWTPTPCPNSADPNRQLLRDSLRKYGLP